MFELKYKKVGDYLLPDMGLSEEDQTPVGKYGDMREKYLREYRPIVYTNLLLSGKPMTHLHEIENTAMDRMDEIMKRLKEQNGVTEQLKARDQMLWVSMMNNLHHQAEETILSELIYV